MIVTADSHLDHGVTTAQLSWLLERFKERGEFFIETVSVPEELGSVPCSLFGPVMGDEPVPEEEVTYATRGGRKGESRLCQRGSRMVSEVTVIAGPHGDHACVLYTVFGGPLAPKEPWDAPDSAESREFWAAHALSV